tara:strand:- start:3764 stop:4042 length:279 start_codon:yes stop_codon:yes gene_type:complete
MGCKMADCMKGDTHDTPPDLHKPTNGDKWRYTLYTTILFLIIVCPWTYKLVNAVLGGIVKICDKKGCPTAAGIIVHAVVFTLLLRCLMDLKA